ncbi:carbamoyl-phosphate synthase (glutamine-hydrolyzing) large subunit [Candidatus Gottesmanbacteria bacterium]|nr:carbamoyl-phosphate synthase (glutamine-hydrolyzing) large subunit [Candidatus Gottesmanbacteria bacterium]
MNTILLLGSGALKIGEAGEFDYSGTQAIKALKEEGKRVVLVNPNVATIQTSEGLADQIYFLPVNAYFVEKVIEKEKPSGILLSFGGQTALNCGIELYRTGALIRKNVAILGTPMEAILATEDRKLFSLRLRAIGVPTAKGKTVGSVDEGVRYARLLGFPVMMRLGFALAGSGSGVAKNEKDLIDLLTKAFATGDQLIIEEDLTGWKEVEYEVVRDKDDNCITVCNMENMDPVGIHTGESIVVAPSQTLNNSQYYSLRQTSIDVTCALGIVGECNIQFAIHPDTNETRVIEVNARLSRSSALASKATGYPLAYIAAKLALGKTLPELKNLITQKTSAFFEPALDYVVVKIPRWDLDKYTHVDAGIGSEMKSVGEVMSIARTFPEAIQKGSRMLGDGYEGVIDKGYGQLSRSKILAKLKKPDSMRLFTILSALRSGISLSQIKRLTHIDRWFLEQFADIVSVYRRLDTTARLTRQLLSTAKQYGFSDKQIADIRGMSPSAVRKRRLSLGVRPVTKHIDTLAAEFPAYTNYLYMTYNGTKNDHSPKSKEKKVIVLGCGPYAVGTSVEFDWCAVSAVAAIRDKGIKTVLINCNPETVSTDFDTADYLYFEELTLERVLDIYEGEVSPFLLAVGGQIANNLAPKLSKLDIPILGTKPENIFRAEHRESFSKLLDRLNIHQPIWKKVFSIAQSRTSARTIGFPIILRPSFVLSGKSMSVVDSEESLTTYLKQYKMSLREYPLVMSKFLKDVTECDVDAVARNGKIVLSAISEHVEHGGVHSGDSTMMLPPVTISEVTKGEIHRVAGRIARALEISGPFNIQLLIADDTPYVIECNIRASRSFPFVSKVLHSNFIAHATNIMLGQTVRIKQDNVATYQAVKVPQFSFLKLKGADPVLRVEMSSTGEVCAIGRDVFESYLTAILATGQKYPLQKAVFLSLGGGRGKLQFLKGATFLSKSGYMIYSTAGTHLFLKENSIASTRVGKMYEGTHPNVFDLLNKKQIDFAVVIPEHYTDRGATEFRKSVTDGYLIRRKAIDMGIPVCTNAPSATLFVEAIRRYSLDDIAIKSWNEYVS